MKKLLVVILAAFMTLGVLTGCSKGLSAEEESKLKKDIIESTEHAMILNDFVAYMFGVGDTGEVGLIGGGDNFNGTVEMLRVNNYIEYNDHIEIVKEERNKIVETVKKAGNVSDDIKAMYDNYIIITDLAFDPSNEENSKDAYAKEYQDAKALAEKIYEYK